MDSATTVQSQVREFLDETGRKKKWFAAQLGVSPAVLSQWLMGKTTFSDKRLGDVLDVIRNNH